MSLYSRVWSSEDRNTCSITAALEERGHMVSKMTLYLLKIIEAIYRYLVNIPARARARYAQAHPTMHMAFVYQTPSNKLRLSTGPGCADSSTAKPSSHRSKPTYFFHCFNLGAASYKSKQGILLKTRNKFLPTNLNFRRP